MVRGFRLENHGGEISYDLCVGWIEVGWWNLPIPWCFLQSDLCNRRAHSFIPPARCCIQDLKPLKQEDLFPPSPFAPALRPVRRGAIRPPRGRSRVPFFPAGVPVRQIVPDRPVRRAKAPGAGGGICIVREQRGKPPCGVHGGGPVREKFFRGNPLSRGGVGIRGMRSRDLKSRQDETRLVGPPLCVFFRSRRDLQGMCLIRRQRRLQRRMAASFEVGAVNLLFSAS